MSYSTLASLYSLYSDPASYRPRSTQPQPQGEGSTRTHGYGVTRRVSTYISTILVTPSRLRTSTRAARKAAARLRNVKAVFKNRTDLVKWVLLSAYYHSDARTALSKTSGPHVPARHRIWSPALPAFRTSSGASHPDTTSSCAGDVTHDT